MDQNTQRNYYLGLDIMRAIAAVLIVVYHYDIHQIAGISRITEVFFGTLWSMVDLFFVLSGFLIASGWFKEINSKGSASFKNFYVKRFFRIMPLYYVVILFYWIKNVLIMGREEYNPLNLILFVQNYIGEMGNFSVSWSLAVEEHFYLLFPLCSLFFLKSLKKEKSVYIWPILILIITALRYIKADQVYEQMQLLDYKTSHDLFEKLIYIPTHLRLDGLLFGVFLASLRVFKSELWSRLKNYKKELYFLGAICLIFSFIFSAQRYEKAQMAFSFSLMAISFSILLIPLFHENFDMNKLSSKGVKHLAKLSYPIYLLHYPSFYLIDIILNFLRIENDKGVGNFIFTIVFIYVISYFANILIEQPMLKLRRKFIH